MKGAGFACGLALGLCVHFLAVDQAPVDLDRQGIIPAPQFWGSMGIADEPPAPESCSRCLGADSMVNHASLAIAPADDAALPADLELQALDEALADANTFGSQMDITIASGEIATYWSARLSELEEEMLATLSPEEADGFQIAQEAWRVFRDAEIEFLCSWDSYGTMAPAIRHDLLTTLTQKRVISIGSALQASEETSDVFNERQN